MADDSRPQYFGTQESAPSGSYARSVEDNSDAHQVVDYASDTECGLCGDETPVVVRDVGEVVVGSVAVARYLPLCRTCSDLAEAADVEGLKRRAPPWMRQEGHDELVASALASGTTLED